MEVTKPYEFIGFGAMEVTKPYEFIGFGAAWKDYGRGTSKSQSEAAPGRAPDRSGR